MVDREQRIEVRGYAWINWGEDKGHWSIGLEIPQWVRRAITVEAGKPGVMRIAGFTIGEIGGLDNLLLRAGGWPFNKNWAFSEEENSNLKRIKDALALNEDNNAAYIEDLRFLINLIDKGLQEQEDA